MRAHKCNYTALLARLGNSKCFTKMKDIKKMAFFGRKVFSLDLNAVRVAADLQVSGSLFQIFGA